MGNGMVPAGYMVKAIAPKPDWLSGAKHVQDIYSLSDCISKNFCELSDYWRHNGHWLFDDLQMIRQIASQNVIDLSAMSWFYYEVYDQDYDEGKKSWAAYAIDDFPSNVVAAPDKKLCGFDIVSFSTGNRPECSPLSCNHLCEIVETDEHCLLPSFERAMELVQSAAFDRVEPGPYRIFSVYELGQLPASLQQPGSS